MRLTKKFRRDTGVSERRLREWPEQGCGEQQSHCSALCPWAIVDYVNVDSAHWSRYGVHTELIRQLRRALGPALSFPYLDYGRNALWPAGRISNVKVSFSLQTHIRSFPFALIYVFIYGRHLCHGFHNV